MSPKHVQSLLLVVMKYMDWSFISKVEFKIAENENSHAQVSRVRI